MTVFTYLYALADIRNLKHTGNAHFFTAVRKEDSWERRQSDPGYQSCQKNEKKI